jgi:hypothetical protein
MNSPRTSTKNHAAQWNPWLLCPHLAVSTTTHTHRRIINKKMPAYVRRRASQRNIPVHTVRYSRVILSDPRETRFLATKDPRFCPPCLRSPRSPQVAKRKAPKTCCPVSCWPVLSAVFPSSSPRLQGGNSAMAPGHDALIG